MLPMKPEQLNERLNQAKPIFYSISNYFWILLIAFFFIYFNFKKQYQEVPIIESFDQPRNWNSSSDPHIFGLISDLHISNFFPETISHTQSILHILNETGVEKILISGDICDNFASKTSIKHGQQYEDDFISFSKIFNKYQDDLFIIASGNHDEFGIEHYNSSNHFILKYANFYRKNDIYKNYDNFLISKVKYDEDIEIIIMNPYQYPTVRAGLGYFMNINKKILDKIEKFVSAPTNSTTRILLTHFPLSYINSFTKSTSKKTLIDIISSNNITAIFAGHTHKELILHRKKTLEIQPTSIKGGLKKGAAFRYITIDNGGLSSESFRLSDGMPTAVLTYPIQKKYLSSMVDFSYKKFLESEIRVVHFSENSNLNISVSCSTKRNNYNDIKKKELIFQRFIRPNQSLYSTSLKKLCNRENFNDKTVNECHLEFTGDWNYSADFAFGNHVKLDKEILCKDVAIRKGIIVVGILCWIFIAFIWFPLKPLKYFNLLNDWLTYNGNTKDNVQLDLFDTEVALIFGFLPMKSRIYNNIPSWIRCFYFILILAPIFAPISLMKIGDKSVGFIFFCGYYLKSFELDIWGAVLTSYYVLFVLLTSTIVFSSISYFNEIKKWHFVFTIDIIIFLLQFYLLKIAIFDVLYQSTNLFYAFTSTVFIMSPICIVCLEIISFVKFLNSTNFQTNNKNSKNDEDIKGYSLELI